MKYEIMMSILFELLSKRVVTASYLANKYEVSVRTIHRYLLSMEYSGVPIYTNRGNGGGYSIVDTYRLPSTFMTEKEFEQTINALSSFNDGLPSKELDSAITKLKAIRKNEYSGFDIKSGNLVIDGGPWGDTIGYKSKLLTIKNAIENLQQLQLTYHDRNGTITERIIDPYVIVFKQGLWYVYAYCHLREEFRFFKIGRIAKATVLDSKFKKIEIDKSNLPFENWYSNVETVSLSIEIKQNVLSDVEEWIGVENISNENGKFIAQVKLPNDDGLISKIISFGDGIKILAPQEIKNKIKEKVYDIIKNYN